MTCILVVDDNPVDRKLIGGLLHRETGWEVETANDGQQALEQIQQKEIDLVVTDLQMPVMDGLTLVKQVRAKFERLPIVLVTAFGSEKESIAALQAGAANFSHKSRLNIDLVPTVRNVLDWTVSVRRSEARRAVGESDSGSHSVALSRELAFVLDNNVGQIRHLIETLDSNLPDWAQADSLRISMALEEALANAICHGNLEVDSSLKDQDDCCAYEDAVAERSNSAPFCQRRVRVRAEFTDQKICFQIDDEGPGFNLCDQPDPTAPENIMKPSGRGLLLIRSFMDQVLHNDLGNRVTLVKNRNQVD